MEINEIKDHLRFLEDETEGIKRNFEEVKRNSPIEVSKILPIGFTMLLLGLLFAFSSIWTMTHQLGGFLFVVNGILALGLIYFGTKITKIGFNFYLVSRKNDRIMQKTEKLKFELEKLLAEKLQP